MITLTRSWLLAGDVMAVTSKATSGDKGKFEATVKSVLIGKVPDRGGRPTEGRAAAAAASMPDWAPRSTNRTSAFCSSYVSWRHQQIGYNSCSLMRAL